MKFSGTAYTAVLQEVFSLKNRNTAFFQDSFTDELSQYTEGLRITFKDTQFWRT